ncbi:pyrroline-5-carboxylate reductase [Halanaeroarchaeum sulfurireducens]|uniref:Pyrroline-5-carboxylate reductase n=1 Tax=Halanaeroarchaeum sulfurireducens TaxID=1604004 RepID=A0A0F7PAX2_9EURY|nr:pyrroline-5-carboxylate reductase [Halanaeroarchaeum sulfurireducens]AKH97867.1 pyrroline-5-carboxylate reductase [Halanaeroarchaeum sulfurireducens]ALG82261.1 pyrroline-5-carboxylate reductase [Halanaeroarchaeum sulfurireducens]
MVEVSVIGCGHLGSAVIRGLAKSDNHTITACDLDEDALDAVEPHVDRTTKEVREAASAPVVILAVRPQTVSPVLNQLQMSPEQTLLSFAAAVPTDFIEERTGGTVVRGMPNLAVETGSTAAAVTAEGDEDVRNILDDLGKYVVVDESLMDIATALNGSGPAFVFYLIKIMAAAGVESGLAEDDAARLAAQTFKGAAEIVLQSEESLDHLIDAVTSEGGTTIEGMEVLRESEVDDVMERTIRAAEERSIEITNDFERD